MTPLIIALTTRPGFKQAAYALYRRQWSAAAGNPLPTPGSGPTKYDQSGF